MATRGLSRIRKRDRTGPLTLHRDELRRAVGILCRRDARLRQIVRAYGPPPLWARPQGFQTLSRIILEQQVSLASGKAIFIRLERRLGTVTASRVALAGITTLRRIGVTRQKSSYLTTLAREIEGRRVDLSACVRLTDEEVRQLLESIRGIGPWTADVYLLMALRRRDIWPRGDRALHVAMKEFLKLRSIPDTARAETIARRWSPLRSVAARILWHGYLESRRLARRNTSVLPSI